MSDAGDGRPLATILFVDDEPNVLQGIRRSTRSMRNRWNIHVADSGPAGLEMLAELERIDVVVSDMRMPGMDGAEFLTEVRKQYPMTARIILSGQADRGSIFRAIGPAHQYLAKPCDTEELIRIIDRIWASGDGLLCEPVSHLVGQVDRLPSPPELFTRINDIMDADDWSLPDLASVIEEDVGMTATVLKLVNSSFFGFYNRVETVEQAISLLGIETLKGVVLGEQMYQEEPVLAEWLDLEALGARSQAAAHTARALALRAGEPPSVAAEAFLGGVVNEVGLIVMARLDEVPETVAETLNELVDTEIEWAVFGGSRFRVSAHLLNLWGFSAELVAAIGALDETPPGELRGLGWYLAAARHLAALDGFDVDRLITGDEPPGLDEILEAFRRGEANEMAVAT